MVEDTAKEAMFQKYHNAGPSLDLIVPAVALYLVVICGVTMNSFVVYVTLKSRSLRSGTTHLLMGLICLFEVIHQSGHTFFLVVVLSGKNFVSLLTADLFMAPMIFGSNANMVAMAGAAADRLFAIAAPYKHTRLTTEHKVSYLVGHLFVYCLFGLYTLYYILDFAFQNPEIPTTGVISETLSGPMGDKFFVYTTVLNAFCIVCYLLIWALIQCKNGVSQQTNTRLLRSLVVIMLVSIGGYLINLTVYQFLFILSSKSDKPVLVWQLSFVVGILLNMGVAANAPILYLNSTEYRKAFKYELKRLAKLCGRQTDQTTSTGKSSLLFRHVGGGQPQHKSSENAQSIAIKRY